MDVTVMCEAQCNTDHMMLKMKLQFGRKNFKSRCSGRLMEKYDVLKLQYKGRVWMTRRGQQHEGSLRMRCVRGYRRNGRVTEAVV